MSNVSFTTEGRRVALAAVTQAPVDGPLTVILMVDTHDFTQDPTYVAAIAGDEIAATNYTRQLANTSSLTPQTDGRVVATIDPTAFGNVGGGLDATIGGCYLFADTGNDATAPVLMCVEFETPQTTDGTPLVIQWNPETATFHPTMWA